MANNKDFKVKNGIKPTVYHEAVGTVTSGTEAYNLTVASYDSKSFSVAGQELNPFGIAFKTDGTKMYIAGNTGDDINQYTLSTAWDVSTASFDSVTFSVISQATTLYGLFFKPDGTKFYVPCITTDAVYQYTLSTAWDLSTASYESKSLSVSAQGSGPAGLYFKSDGLTLFILDYIPDTVFEYTLSTAWDISTASYSSNSVSVASTGEALSLGLWFSDDGTKFIVAGDTNDKAYEFTMTTAWDITTASYSGVSFDLTAAGSTPAPTGITFKTDGTKMYSVMRGNDTIYQYSTALYTRTLDLSTGSVFEITPTSDIQIGLSNPAASGTVSAATLLLDGAAASAYDIASATYDSVSFSVATQETAPRGLFFKPDGTKMYIAGNLGDDVNEYDLSTAWDVSTASYLQNFSVATQEIDPSGLFFKPDGTKMYVIGYNGDDVNEYSLSTAWDVSTASYVQNFSVAAQDTTPLSLFFKSDGTKMYHIGNAGDNVNEYNLSTAWDISTASYVQNFSVATEETNPLGLTFKPDGTKMFIVGSIGDDVNEYSLSTAWDISTASYVRNFSVSAQEATPTCVFFKSDGTKMYIVGLTSNTVFQYTTGSIATITYDTSIEFAGGTAPTSPAVGETDILTFSTRNGGTSYQSVLAIDGAK